MKTLVSETGSIVAIVPDEVEVTETHLVTASCSYLLEQLGAYQLVDGEPPSLNGHMWDGDSWQALPPPAPEVPAAVTMRQARLVLLQAGLLDDVAAAIAAMPSPAKEAAQIEWEYSQEVRRNKALVLALTPALGLTSEQVDAMFITAASL